MYQLYENLITYILNPVIILLLAVALMIFVWGIVQYIANSDSEEARRKGRSHIIWGLVGLVIMVSVRGIIELLRSTIDTL